jgi:alpha-N-acetylglucosaminidase
LNRSGHDVFEVAPGHKANQVILRGNNAVSMASAFNYYLKNYCFAHVSWGVNGTGNQLNVPLPVPNVEKTTRVEV